jgi:ABC-2 type transport system permease protein
MAPLVGKLLRDIRVPLVVVALLLVAFQCLWARVTERIQGQLAPIVFGMARASGMVPENVIKAVFEGPARVLRPLVGGEKIKVERAQDMLTVGYVHPLIQIIFCIWAVGRAAGAIAGELDRGTMELLLAQPLARSRLILAHFCVDLIVLPILCLSLWAGTWLGVRMVSPIKVEIPPEFKKLSLPVLPGGARDEEDLHKQLELEARPFLPALWVVGGLMFAVSGSTLWLSALGRFRWRVLGLAIFLLLIQFLINLIGQIWDVLAPLRPLTIFYYFQPQQVILGGSWCVTWPEWHGGKDLVSVPMLVVLFGTGLVGYGLALWTFTSRDLPAPL